MGHKPHNLLLGARAVVLLVYMGLAACGVKSKTSQSTKTSDLAILPPPSQYDVFYGKYIDAEGIPIVSSAAVDDEALFQAHRLSLQMLKNIPEVRQRMIVNRIKIAIIGKDEATTDIPEYQYLKTNLNTDWDERARGLGATWVVPVSSVGEENILCLAKDRYHNEDIFVHEFAHSIHLLGLQYVYLNFNTELAAAYNNAMQLGLYEKTYAATNAKEYFAEGVQSWFDVNAQMSAIDGSRKQVHSRQELKTYDPKLYKLLATYFSDEDMKLSCHRVGEQE